MRIEPFVALHPVAGRAASFAAPPYDVLDDTAARAYVAAHPASFMEIDRPEVAFDAGQDPTAPEVYAHAARLLAARVEDGTLVQDGVPCLYLYRLEQDGHAQTGVVASASVDEYRGGTIRRHEQVREAKVADRAQHIRATGAQTSAVLLAYDPLSTIGELVAAVCTEDPLCGFADDDGVRHVLWRVCDPTVVGALCTAFEQVPRAYIADGHHRAAASARVRDERLASTGDVGPSSGFLAILFPTSEMRVLAYNRVVADAAGLGEDELLSAVREAGFAVGGPCAAPAPPARRGTFGMYAFGQWHELVAEDAATLKADPTAMLDVTILQDRVLAPVLGIIDPRSDPRISFVSGADGTGELERLAAGGGVAFSLFPTSVAELVRVSEAGLLMPPKSTWFAPKPLSGLFMRRV